MQGRFASFLSYTWRSAIVLLTLEVAIVSALRYFTHAETPPDVILANAYANPFLILHVIGGVTALVVGPLQFVPRIRARVPKLHRATGRIYIAACALAAPAGFMLALGTAAGPVAGVGFAIPAILWPIFTYAGVRSAIERKFDAHREWMLRSYAITLNALTLRLMLPAAGMLGFDFLTSYRAISWLGWIVNLMLVEIYLRRKQLSPMSEAKLATA